MRRNGALAGAFLVLMAVFFTSCGQKAPAAQQIFFDQLSTHPQSYDLSNVVLDGFYFSGFEVNVLAERLVKSDLAPGHLVPDGIMIWVNGGLSTDVYEKLYQQQQMGPLERFGEVRITGLFEYGAKYGHLAGYDYQITPSKAEFLSWWSPQAVQ